MTTIFFLRLRIVRNKFQTSSMIFLVGILCVFTYIFDGFIEQKKEAVDEAYRTIPVKVVVSNVTGTQTDNLKIHEYLVDYFISEQYAYGGIIQERAFSSYVKEVNVKSTIYWRMKNISAVQKIVGIYPTGLLLDDSIVFEGGFNSEVLLSDEAVCIIPESYLEYCSEEMNGNLLLDVELLLTQEAYEGYQDTLRVVGTYSSENEMLYCPWKYIASVQRKLSGLVFADSLSAIVYDNYELDEFREILMRHFAEVDPSGYQEEVYNSPALKHFPFAITIYDKSLRNSLNSLNRNLWMLYFMKPILITIEILIAFISFFILFYSRRRELIIMHSLGARRAEIRAGVLVETFFLCFCGTVLYILFYYKQGNMRMSVCVIGIIVACVTGAFVAEWFINRQNNVLALREKM